jgi:hypothetical protein
MCGLRGAGLSYVKSLFRAPEFLLQSAGVILQM